jgi:hypothetical protein
MTTRNKSNDRIQYFASSGEYVEHVKTSIMHEGWREDHAKNYRASNWDEGVGFDGAIKLASEGWPEGMKKLQGAMDILRGQSKGKARVNDVGGDYPIVARAIAGLPDSMSRRVMSSASRKPILDIYLYGAFSAGVDSGQFIVYGAALVDFVDSCEAAGYSVNITVNMTVFNEGRRNGITGSIFPIKKAGEALDLGKLVYFIAHPSFLRRLGFQDLQSKQAEKILGYGMGNVIHELPVHKEFSEPDALLFLPDMGTLNSFTSPDKARAWVHATVKAQRPELIDSLGA